MMQPGSPLLQCLDPDRIKSDLLALQDSMQKRVSELNAIDMQLMRWSNVSSEQYLSNFLYYADSLFSSFFRQTWIDEALRFFGFLRQRFGTAPAPQPMPPVVYMCRDPMRTLTAINEIERQVMVMQAIFNQMAGPYLADRARLQAVIGRSPTSVPPEGDPGRGSRPLSAAEQRTDPSVRHHAHVKRGAPPLTVRRP